MLGSRVFDASPTRKWQSAAIQQVHFRFKLIISHCFTRFFCFADSSLSSDPQDPAVSNCRIS